MGMKIIILTNIAAIAYIGKRVDRPRMVLLSGLMYTIGRTASYVILGVLVVASVLLSMGMMMLPPVMVSLPFKLMLFVLADGWYLIIGSLVKSFV